MTQPIELSHTEENYIKVIYHLSEKNEAVSTNAIADMLSTKPASVSDMLKKLDSKSLINYIKYKGVTLTEEGKSIALWIIRKHRLWEVFLVEKMKFNWDEVHEVAEQLEHIKSRRLIEQLDWFLEFPKYDPHGDPIPDSEGKVRQLPTLPLSEATMKTDLKVVTVSDSSSEFLQYLDKVGISIGIHIKIVDKIAYDGSLELEIDGKTHLISRQGAQNILVVA
ncbi:metal-dependent transcriptional regulator [Flammeovirgaceae bacterium SG7u.111]|nr:metal-dependent transcriptional regulator [Flammeovirgaceae bacterium SG7u.132]WPO35958.1 metal-dependent transcriptional regulator [Flammeovirgaceae bacterium SG7u.111]